MNNPHHNNAPNNPGQNRAASYAEVLKHNDDGTWTSGGNGRDLLPPHGGPDLPDVCYVFLDDGDWFKGEDKSPECSRNDRAGILAHFNMPGLLAGQMCTDLNGYFGCRSSLGDTGDNAGKLEELNTWFRCLTKLVLNDEELRALRRDDGGEVKNYAWYEMGFFTNWTSNGKCRMLCVGTPPAVRIGLERRLQEEPALVLSEPFAMVRVLLDEVIKLYDEHTWRITKLVRAVEKNRNKRPSFEYLNNLSRHIRHMVEVEAVAVETVAHIARQQKDTFTLLTPQAAPGGATPSGGAGSGITGEYKIRAEECLAFQEQLVRSVWYRAQATQQRLGDEVTLAYNMLACSDNAVIKSITLLAMVFLPPTFISALFSTTFFSYADNSWNFSNKFWIYWVVAVPLTLVLLTGWWAFLGGSSQLRNKWLGTVQRPKRNQRQQHPIPNHQKEAV